MAVQLSWQLENRVLLVANSGAISDQDMLDVDQPIDRMNQSNVPLVHLIVDNSDATYNPSIKTVSQAKFPKHPQCGWVLLVGPTSTFTRFVNAVVTNVLRREIGCLIRVMKHSTFSLNEVDSALPPLRDIKREKVS